MAVTYCSTKNESKAFCNLTISKANPLTKRQKNVVKLLHSQCLKINILKISRQRPNLIIDFWLNENSNKVVKIKSDHKCCKMRLFFTFSNTVYKILVWCLLRENLLE